MKKTLRRLLLLLPLLLAAAALHAEEFITLASTTSTEQSGLFGHLLPLFEQKSGIKVRVVALGTGQALDTGRRGDADVLLVHDRAAEDKFVADGFGAFRRDVMFNDFVVVGPKADPARAKAAADAVDAFRRIAAGNALFVSRGDKSGTHAAELRFWKEAGVDAKSLKGYKEAGSGMGPTLNMAAGIGAYTLADRGTWAAFRNPQDLEIVFAGDRRLHNPYGVIPVNPAKHPHVKKEAAQKFADWITSDDGRAAIASFRVNGQQLFFVAPK